MRQKQTVLVTDVPNWKDYLAVMRDQEVVVPIRYAAAAEAMLRVGYSTTPEITTTHHQALAATCRYILARPWLIRARGTKPIAEAYRINGEGRAITLERT